MKAIIIFSILLGQLIGVEASVIDTISSALRNGQPSSLNQYYAGSVDVTILDFQDFVDKGTAISKVNNFFNGKVVTGYKIIHEGKSKGKDSVYTIGALTTDKGKYQVYMFITSKDGKYFIEEIKIEE